MPDTKLGRKAARRLDQFAAAADIQRFRLLAHAAVHKTFLATDAEVIARGLKTNSGTARTGHVGRLTEVGLLRRREDPVRYEITADGRLIYNTLRESLDKPAPHRHVEDDLAMLVVTVGQLKGAPADSTALAKDLATGLEQQLRQVAQSVRTTAARAPR